MYYYYYYCLGHCSCDFFPPLVSCGSCIQLLNHLEQPTNSFSKLETTAIQCRKYVVLAKRFKTFLLCAATCGLQGGHCITASFDDALRDGPGGQIAEAI